MLGVRELIGRLRYDPGVRRPASAGRDYAKPVQDPEGIGPGVADLPDWELALSLVDRDDQVIRMSERLEEFKKDGAERAFLVIVHGTNLDCHRYFPARCATWDFRKRTGVEWANLGTLKWWSSLPLVIGEISGKLGADNVRDVEPLSALLKRQDRYICFSHIIGPEDWGADGKILKEWVEIFAEGRLTVHPARFLVAFLCLQHRVETTEDCRKLQQMAADWDTANRPSVVVMPKLELVRQTDLQTWPGTAATLFRRSIQLGEAEIAKIFEGEDNRKRYMKHVADELEQRLQSQFEAGPRVAPTKPWR